MEIIFGREKYEMLKDRYTILELEAILVPGQDKKLDIYCMIPTEKIPVDKLSELPRWIKLHEEFIDGYKKGANEYCLQAIEYLMGQFGGEVDTFYSEIKNRIETTK